MIIRKTRNYQKKYAVVSGSDIKLYLSSVYDRFFLANRIEETQIYDSNTYIKEYTYLGIVGEVKDGLIQIEQRNKFSVGETIEIMKPDGRNVEAKVVQIITRTGKNRKMHHIRSRSFLWNSVSRRMYMIC